MADKNNTRGTKNGTGNVLRDGLEAAANTVEKAIEAFGEATEQALNRTLEAAQTAAKPLTDRENEDAR